jgi:hypothetical protein
MTNAFSLGFRVVGSPYEDRRLVDHPTAFTAYVNCDDRADVCKEAYLSAFVFGDELRHRADEWGRLDVKGFDGSCWSPWLWFDIDREDLDAALRDARRLAAILDERYRLGEDDVLLFFSGGKGFHVGLPTSAWSPAPGETFHRTARRFAENVAELAGVAIDSGVFDKVRLFRAPNSRHTKTGLHKRRLTFDELNGLSLGAVLEKAKYPEPFDLPAPTRTSDQAAADWQAAAELVAAETASRTARRSSGSATLNRATLAFIRDGADQGDRHRLLYSAAANLGEFGCPSALAHALLAEPALDSGLSPADVRRQIDCGLAAVCSPLPAAGNGEPPPARLPPAAVDVHDQLARLWDATAELTANCEPPADLHQDDDIPQQRTPLPAPPPGARLHFADSKGRPCLPDEAKRWTWEGAPTWFDTPIPNGGIGCAP